MKSSSRLSRVLRGEKLNSVVSRLTVNAIPETADVDTVNGVTVYRVEPDSIKPSVRAFTADVEDSMNESSINFSPATTADSCNTAEPGDGNNIHLQTLSDALRKSNNNNNNYNSICDSSKSMEIVEVKVETVGLGDNNDSSSSCCTSVSESCDSSMMAQSLNSERGALRDLSVRDVDSEYSHKLSNSTKVESGNGHVDFETAEDLSIPKVNLHRSITTKRWSPINWHRPVSEAKSPRLSSGSRPATSCSILRNCLDVRVSVYAPLAHSPYQRYLKTLQCR